MNEEQITQLAKKHVEARTGLTVHISMYLIVNAGLFAVWWFSGAPYPWFIWPLIGWGAGLLSHVLTYWLGPDSPRGIRAIEREAARLRAAEHH